MKIAISNAPARYRVNVALIAQTKSTYFRTGSNPRAVCDSSQIVLARTIIERQSDIHHEPERKLFDFNIERFLNIEKLFE